MKKLAFFSLFAMVALVLSSCKYEEGPFISVIPKTERVTNTWIVGQAIIDGQSESELSGFTEITFYKEGNCTMVLNFFGSDFPYSGTWEFNEDATMINIDVTDEATGFTRVQESYTIIRLKEKELWVTYVEEDAQGNDTNYEIHFIPKAS